MKNKLYISLFAACALGFTACHSDVDNFMVDDTVGLLKSGLVDAQIYDGIQTVTPVYAIKAGKGRQSAEVSIAVDDEVLVAYNDLKSTVRKAAAVPADCYTVTVSKLNLTVEDYRQAFEITWDTEKLQAALAENSNIVVPLRMTVHTEGATVANDRLTILLRPVVSKPYLALKNPGVQTKQSPSRLDNPEKSLFNRVEINFDAPQDIEYGIEVAPELLDEYNAANGTAYNILPEEAYRLDETGVIKKGLQYSDFKLNFFRTALVPEREATKFGLYMLPIRIKSLDNTPLAEDKSVLYYVFDVDAAQLQKGRWTVIDCNSDLKDDPGATEAQRETYSPAMLIDGSTSTCWRSVFTVEQELPYYFTIDLGRMTSLYKLGFQVPSNGAEKNWHNSKAGYVEVSLDGENWTKLADWAGSSRTIDEVIFMVEPTVTRYVRFYITENWRNATGGIKNKKHTAIGEFNAWGEVATWLEDETTEETPAE